MKKSYLFIVPYVIISTIWIIVNKGWEKQNFYLGLKFISLAIGWWVCIMILSAIFKTKIERSEKLGDGCLFNLFFWLTIAVFGLGLYGLILIWVE